MEKKLSCEKYSISTGQFQENFMLWAYDIALPPQNTQKSIRQLGKCFSFRIFSLFGVDIPQKNHQNPTVMSWFSSAFHALPYFLSKTPALPDHANSPFKNQPTNKVHFPVSR